MSDCWISFLSIERIPVMFSYVYINFFINFNWITTSATGKYHIAVIFSTSSNLIASLFPEIGGLNPVTLLSWWFFFVTFSSKGKKLSFQSHFSLRIKGLSCLNPSQAGDNTIFGHLQSAEECPQNEIDPRGTIEQIF